MQVSYDGKDIMTIESRDANWAVPVALVVTGLSLLLPLVLSNRFGYLVVATVSLILALSWIYFQNWTITIDRAKRRVRVRAWRFLTPPKVTYIDLRAHASARLERAGDRAGRLVMVFEKTHFRPSRHFSTAVTPQKIAVIDGFLHQLSQERILR